jgi:hypothetical protein
MARFLAWFNGPMALDALLKAAVAHLWFVTIHPFEDGNERLARADYLLSKLTTQQKALRAWSIKALDGVKFKYGPDSPQHEMTGSIRQSERKKFVRKPKGEL